MMVPLSPMSWQRNVNDVTTPKFPPPPRRRPEQIAVGVFASGDESAVGEYDVGRDQVVYGKSEAPRQVTDAAAERQARHAGRRQESGRRGHPECDRRMVDITPGAAGIGADGVILGVDGGAAQQ